MGVSEKKACHRSLLAAAFYPSSPHIEFLCNLALVVLGLAFLSTSALLWHTGLDSDSLTGEEDEELASHGVPAQAAYEDLGQEDAYWNASFFHVHIPKVAGSSLRKDMQNIMPPTAQLKSAEHCYHDADGMLALVLLRKPQAHILSQYTHCTTSPTHMYGFELIPKNMTEWLEAWTQILSKKDTEVTNAFCCANPIDMQAYRMVCEKGSMGSSNEPKSGRSSNDVNVEEAIFNMKKAWFLGIQEAYRESICLLRTKITGVIPHFCACDERAPPSVKVHHVTHGVASHNISDLPVIALQRLDDITAKDRELYNAGLKRFLEDVEEVHKVHGKRILCRKLTPAQPLVPAEQRSSARVQVDLQAWLTRKTTDPSHFKFCRYKYPKSAKKKVELV